MDVKTDCFAYKGGKCVTTTNVCNGKCCFYKSEKQHIADVRKAIDSNDRNNVAYRGDANRSILRKYIGKDEDE